MNTNRTRRSSRPRADITAALADLSALQSAPAAPVAVGTVFDLSDSKSYTLDGQPGEHVTTVRYRVTSVDDRGLHAEYVETVAEEGRPPFASNPVSVSIAHFAFPLYVAKGRATLVDAA